MIEVTFSFQHLNFPFALLQQKFYYLLFDLKCLVKLHSWNISPAVPTTMLDIIFHDQPNVNGSLSKSKGQSMLRFAFF